ncbi:MAG: SAM-dependent methyltransferase [Candidatus Wallacebacter cryptica]|jgi:SAM-dependent methyltransferase|nr:SAM-dependent methyltransferase [Bacillota bacterium]
MSAKRYDKELGIRTVGLREWDGHHHYNRYEATPYEALDVLFQSYSLKHHERVVDFGCGRGRVAFYIHKHFQIPVVGIEANDLTFNEALDNKYTYRLRAKHISAPIKFKFGLAERYQVKPQDTCFYFFNPFSAKVFAKVLRNIIASVKAVPRTIDIILFYPLPDYKDEIRKYPFRKINKVRVPGAEDPHDKFIIYRLVKEDIEEMGNESQVV